MCEKSVYSIRREKAERERQSNKHKGTVEQDEVQMDSGMYILIDMRRFGNKRGGTCVPG